MAQRGNKLMRFADRWGGIPLVALMGLCHRRSTALPEKVERIGLVALGAVGDMLLSVGTSVPALREKYPGAEICVFTTASNKALIPLLPAADKVVTVPLSRPDKALKLMAATHFDLLIDFSPWPRIGAVLTAGAGADFTAGFATAHQHRHFAYDRAVPHRCDVHELENNAALLRTVGIDTLPPPDIRAAVGPSDVPEAARGYGHYVVFHPWAAGFRKDMREWPAGHWQALAAKVTAAGYAVFVTGGPTDREESAALIRSFGLSEEKVFNACGTTLTQTAALLKYAAAMVSVNTGPMHLGAALGVPLIALNGPTDPQRWRPLSEKAVCLSPEKGDFAYLDLGFEYPKNVAPCMQDISVDRVWNALLHQLGSPENTEETFKTGNSEK